MEMKKMRVMLFTVLVILSMAACSPGPPLTPAAGAILKQSYVDLGTHKLAAFSIIQHSKYLVVFESGLGDDHMIWNTNDIVMKTSQRMDVVTYDRAYRGQSEYKGPVPRNINQLQSELTGVIDTFAQGRKVILVGHSLGGFIVRDWAIKNPTRMAGLLLVDPSNEVYEKTYTKPTQADEDAMYDYWSSYGLTFGATLEAREWLEDLDYMATLGNLPDIPVIVLTATKADTPVTAADRQNWYDGHETLKNGVTDFTHVALPNSGHMVMIDDPQDLMANINLLISKMP